LAYDLAFGPLGFTQARFDVRQANISVWKLHEKTGARKIREDAINRYYEYLADDYQVARVWLKKFAQIKDTHEHPLP
jgi:tRNA U38,U39,U40 pseudouridine synthase TruA